MELTLDQAMLDRLMPMSLVVNNDGTIRHIGPTLAKTRPDGFFEKQSLFEIFEFRRPLDAASLGDLLLDLDVPLRLSFKSAPHTGLRGSAVPLSCGGAAINLSFGISILEAIKQYGLHSTDFAITDPTMEMLYLIEAKSAAMEETHALNRRLQGARIAAEEQAFTDTLTGLKNRRALDHILKRYTAQGVPFTVMGVDLDYFKSVNDTYGHAAGDHVLQVVAKIMVDATGDDDTVARTGGDEFIILLSGTTDTQKAQQLSLNLIKAAEVPISFEGQTCQISASIGIAATDQFAGVGVECLLAGVDSALYKSKEEGRGRPTIYGFGMCSRPCVDPERCNSNRSDRGSRLDARV